MTSVYEFQLELEKLLHDPEKYLAMSALVTILANPPLLAQYTMVTPSLKVNTAFTGMMLGFEIQSPYM